MRETDSVVSRRGFILSGSALAGGVGLLTLTSQRTRAEVDMGTLSISGDTKEMDSPPSSVQLTVDGSWEITGSTPEQTRVVLQVHADGTARDMDERLVMDNPAAGDYSVSAGLLDHPEIEADELIPSEVGKTAETELTVRIILLAVSNQQIQAETHVEDTAVLKLTKSGLKLAVEGSGEIDVSA